VKRLGELGKIVCGKTPLTNDQSNYGNDVPFITIPDMHNNVFICNTLKALSAKGADMQKNKTLSPFSISASCIATPGLVTINSVKAQTNQQINSLIPEKGLIFYYFYNMKLIANKIKSSGSGGSVFSNLNKTEFEKMTISIAPDNIAKYYNHVVEQCFMKILYNEKQSQILSSIRDLLLPQLIGGRMHLRSC
jgi:type I restriction enzyme S subunit